MWNYLFVYYLRGFRKSLICVQNKLQTDESTIICMIFGLNKNTIQYNTIHQEKQLYLCDTWYLLFCMDDRLVCRVDTSHLHRITSMQGGMKQFHSTLHTRQSSIQNNKYQ